MFCVPLIVPDPALPQILIVSESGHGKRTPVEDFPRKGRGTQGVIAMQTSARNGTLVGAIGGHFASRVSAQRLWTANPWLAAASRAFSILQPTASLVDQLDRFAPSIMATYPTAAALLADPVLATDATFEVLVDAGTTYQVTVSAASTSTNLTLYARLKQASSGTVSSGKVSATATFTGISAGGT